MYTYKWKDILNKKRIKEYNKNTKKTSDKRDEFQNDYDRILFSASFRRLQDKAQVFPLEKLDFVRTRLTHSLEVSSIGKSLAISIGNKLMDSPINNDILTFDMVEDMGNILSCAGLIHDLGNPPFGHFGEMAIRQWFKDKLYIKNNNEYIFSLKNTSYNLDKQEALDLMNFEGNAQGLRILTKLHFVIDRHGMNLTLGVLSSILKYPISSLDKESKQLKKIGYFKAEEPIYNEINDTMKLNGNRNPLVYILEAADDIAYLLGDLEDAFNKKIITHEVFKTKYEEFITEEGFEEKTLEESLSYYLSINYEIAKEEYGYEDPGEYALKSFIIKLNRYFKDCVVNEFINSYDAIMNGSYIGELIGNSKANKISIFLREISRDFVYTNEKIVTNEIVGFNIIHGLLDIFVPAVLDNDVTNMRSYSGKVYSIISKNYRFISEHAIEEGHCSELYCKLLLVTDFICGMTDSYAAHIFKELTGKNL